MAYIPIPATTFDAEKPVFGSTSEQMNENTEESLRWGVIRIETTYDNGSITNNIRPSIDGFTYTQNSSAGNLVLGFEPNENWDSAQTPLITVTAFTVSNDSAVFSSHNLITANSGYAGTIGNIRVLLKEISVNSIDYTNSAGIYKIFIDVKYDRQGVLPV
tara:strand:- start:635 stop:1114 length:480 start_codon:yes stop_codon:yes gene_type:complete